MAAVTTKKPHANLAQELTFPSVYQSVYAAKGPVERYYPTAERTSGTWGIADDFQNDWHYQKCLDANHMAMAKVDATRASKLTYLTARNALPAPVLGQRRVAAPLGAAQSYGNDIYGAVNRELQTRPQGLGMHGGVLRSIEGQKYARRILQRRSQNLDSLEGLARAAPFPGMVGAIPTRARFPSSTDGVGDFSETSKIEFNLLRQELVNSTLQGEYTRFQLEQYGRMLVLLFRYAPSADAEELEDIIQMFDNLNNLLKPYEREGYREEMNPFKLSLYELNKKAHDYAAGMLEGINLSASERLDLSKALVRSLGFTQLLRLATAGDGLGMLDEAVRKRIADDVTRQSFADMDDKGPPPNPGWPRNTPRGKDSFTTPKPDREDTDHGYNPALRSGGPDAVYDDADGLPQYDVDNRQLWAMANGEYKEESGQEAPDEDEGVDGEADRLRSATDTLAAQQSQISPTFTPTGATVGGLTREEELAKAQAIALQQQSARQGVARPPPTPITNMAMGFRAGPSSDALPLSAQPTTSEPKPVEPKTPASMRGKLKPEFAAKAKAAKAAAAAAAAAVAPPPVAAAFVPVIPEGVANRALEQRKQQNSAALARELGLRTITDLENYTRPLRGDKNLPKLQDLYKRIYGRLSSSSDPSTVRNRVKTELSKVLAP